MRQMRHHLLLWCALCKARDGRVAVEELGCCISCSHVGAQQACVAHQAQLLDVCRCGRRAVLWTPAIDAGQQPAECVADRGCCPADGRVLGPLSCQLLQCCRRHLGHLLEQLRFALQQLPAAAGLTQAQVDDQATRRAYAVCVLLEQRQVGRQALLLAREVSEDLLHHLNAACRAAGQRKHGQHLYGRLLSCHVDGVGLSLHCCWVLTS